MRVLELSQELIVLRNILRIRSHLLGLDKFHIYVTKMVLLAIKVKRFSQCPFMAAAPAELS